LDADFIAAHNRGRREIADAHAVRLLAMCGQALDVLDTAMGRGDVKAALAVLKGAGVFVGTRRVSRAAATPIPCVLNRYSEPKYRS